MFSQRTINSNGVSYGDSTLYESNRNYNTTMLAIDNMSEISKRIDQAIGTLISIPGMWNEIKGLRENFSALEGRLDLQSSQRGY